MEVIKHNPNPNPKDDINIVMGSNCIQLAKATVILNPFSIHQYNFNAKVSRNCVAFSVKDVRAHCY